MDSFCIEPLNQCAHGQTHILRFLWKSLLQEYDRNLVDLILTSAFHSLVSSISLKAKECQLVARGMRRAFWEELRIIFELCGCCWCLARTLVYDQMSHEGVFLAGVT